MQKMKNTDMSDPEYESGSDENKRIVKYLKENVKPNDTVLTVGAGPIYLVGEDLLKQEDQFILN